ncbi:MAG: hypothetical protein ACK53Y_04430, partial [bacterium]
VEEGVGGEGAQGDVVGVPTDQFFEFAGVVAGDGEEIPDEEEVKELLLDFGVHEYLVGHFGDEGGQVDSAPKPRLAHHAVYLRQRDHILALKALAGAHTGLVLALQAHFAQVLNERDENVLGVVLLEGHLPPSPRFRVQHPVRKLSFTLARPQSPPFLGLLHKGT